MNHSTKKDLTATIDSLCVAKKWEKALALELDLMATHHRGWQIRTILYHIRRDPQKLRLSNVANDWVVLGFMYYMGRGLDLSNSKAKLCFSTAADLGHVYASYMIAEMVYYGQGENSNLTLGFKLYNKAAERGCVDAYCRMAEAYRYGMGIPQCYFRSAWCYLKANNTYYLKELTSSYPLQCCPFGYWAPDLELQRLIPNTVMAGLRTTLFLCKRLGVDKNVARIIVSYVCTTGASWYVQHQDLADIDK